jgi:hypothetical protein
LHFADYALRIAIFAEIFGPYAARRYLRGEKTKGCPHRRAEIIPSEPDADNAAEGIETFF